MRITEYRIMLPYTVDEVEAMTAYSMNQIKEKGKQGTEFEKDYYGEAMWRQWFSVRKNNKSFNGRFLYYQDSNYLMPKWRQSIFAEESNYLDVRYWVVYGSITKCLITMKMMDNFYVETYAKIRDYSKIGHDNNVFRLYEEQLAQRKIVAVSVRKSGDLISCGRIESEEVPMNEVQDDWVSRSLRVGSPVTCIYYLTCVEFPYKMQAYMEKYVSTKLHEQVLMYHLRGVASLGTRLNTLRADIIANKMKCDERIEELPKEAVSYDQFMAYGLDTIKMHEWEKNYKTALRELEVKALVSTRRHSLDSHL